MEIIIKLDDESRHFLAAAIQTLFDRAAAPQQPEAAAKQTRTRKSANTQPAADTTPAASEKQAPADPLASIPAEPATQAAPAAEQKAEAKPVTLEQLRKRFNDTAKNHKDKVPELSKIIKDEGVSSLTELKEERYSYVLAKVEELTAGAA